MRPIHAVSPAAACSPALSSFYHHYCYRRRYRYRRHHHTSALATLSHSLFSSHTYARARTHISAVLSLFLPLSSPFLALSCLFFLLLLIILLLFSKFVLLTILYFFHSRTHTHKHIHTHTISLSLPSFALHARFFNPFVLYEKDNKPNTQ